MPARHKFRSAPPTARDDHSRALVRASSLPGPVLKRWFDDGLDVEIDVGCNTGWFLEQIAVRHPERRFVGVEVVEARASEAAERVARARLGNAVVVHAEALEFTRKHVPAGSIRCAHIYFPTPYPESLGFDHLLLERDFCGELERVVAHGGCVRLATDDEGVFRRAVGALSGDAWLSVEWTFIDVGQSPSLVVGTPCEMRYGTDRYDAVRSAQFLKK
jgi:tRNA (guanine-N7-)-methyltransferase